MNISMAVSKKKFKFTLFDNSIYYKTVHCMASFFNFSSEPKIRFPYNDVGRKKNVLNANLTGSFDQQLQRTCIYGHIGQLIFEESQVITAKQVKSPV